MSIIERRSVKLTRDLMIEKPDGLEIFFPMGTVFYNYRPNKKSPWDSWFYEYEASGGLGLLLTSSEYEVTA